MSLNSNADKSGEPCLKKRKIAEEEETLTNDSKSSSITFKGAMENGNKSSEAASGAGQNSSSENLQYKIDEGLYSRQLYVLGHDAMLRMASSDVLISGLGGLGVEIAKNVILGGVKSVTLHDTKACSLADLSSQYYLKESDIGQNRAEASCTHLAELNSYVPIKTFTGKLDEDYVKQFKVVVLTESTLEEQLRISQVTHSNNIALIVADTRGVFAQVFCDFGEAFTVIDLTGESPVSAMVASISHDEDGVVTCLDETRHGLEDGDYVTFAEVQGMTELNRCEAKKVRVMGPYTFAIGDTSKLSAYTGGGVAIQVKQPKILKFLSFDQARKEPEFIMTDFAKMERPAILHAAFFAIQEFLKVHGRAPVPWNDADATEFLRLVEGEHSEDDQKLLRLFSYTAAGQLAPMCAVIGGIVAQEVMKGCSGKFHPIKQFLYFDATECVPADCKPNPSFKLPGNRYDSQVAVFGPDFQQQLSALHYFVVGAGAIGCELLKNFAMSGVGT
ncbi:hypothetical protein B566_EDAN001927, partial [Ephemera danica]